MDEVPAPGWFADHRTRVLSIWVAAGTFGSTLVWWSSAVVADGGRHPFAMLTLLGAIVTTLLVVAAVTDNLWLVRKAAGAALLLHLSRLAALGWQIILFDGWPGWAAALQIAGTGVVVGVLAAQAGWLHWVAGLPRGTT